MARAYVVGRAAGSVLLHSTLLPPIGGWSRWSRWSKLTDLEAVERSTLLHLCSTLMVFTGAGFHRRGRRPSGSWGWNDPGMMWRRFRRISSSRTSVSNTLFFVHILMMALILARSSFLLSWP